MTHQTWPSQQCRFVPLALASCIPPAASATNATSSCGAIGFGALSKGVNDGIGLDAIYRVDHKNTRLALWVRIMFGANQRIENVTSSQINRCFDTIITIEHAHTAIQNGKDLSQIIHMPFIGLISPVRSRDDAIHAGNIQRVPRL